MRKLHMKHNQGSISKVMCSSSHRCVEIGAQAEFCLFPKVIPPVTILSSLHDYLGFVGN